MLGTPKMIVIGKKFDGIHYLVEDMESGKIDTVLIDKIVDYFKRNE